MIVRVAGALVSCSQDVRPGEDRFQAACAAVAAGTGQGEGADDKEREQLRRQGLEWLRGLILPGFWYSGTILAILGCHELGHYLACRYYDVDASLPGRV